MNSHGITHEILLWWVLSPAVQVLGKVSTILGSRVHNCPWLLTAGPARQQVMAHVAELPSPTMGETRIEFLVPPTSLAQPCSGHLGNKSVDANSCSLARIQKENECCFQLRVQNENQCCTAPGSILWNLKVKFSGLFFFLNDTQGWLEADHKENIHTNRTVVPRELVCCPFSSRTWK